MAQFRSNDDVFVFRESTAAYTLCTSYDGRSKREVCYAQDVVCDTGETRGRQGRAESLDNTKRTRRMWGRIQ